MNFATPSSFVILVPITDFDPFKLAMSFVFFNGPSAVVAETDISWPSFSSSPLLLWLNESGNKFEIESIFADNASCMTAETLIWSNAAVISSSNLTGDLGLNISFVVLIVIWLLLLVEEDKGAEGQLAFGANLGLITIMGWSFDVALIPFAKQSMK